MASRLIIIPRFTITDQHGNDFAARIAAAIELLAKQDYTDITTSYVFDADESLVACDVTGGLTFHDGRQFN